MRDITAIVIACIGSAGLWTVINTVIQHLINRRGTHSAEAEMILGLGHDRICFLCMKYIEAGSITAEEFENLYTYLYLPYKALGGNGTAERLMNEVQKLPLRGGSDTVR